MTRTHDSAGSGRVLFALGAVVATVGAFASCGTTTETAAGADSSAPSATEAGAQPPSPTPEAAPPEGDAQPPGDASFPEADGGEDQLLSTELLGRPTAGAVTVGVVPRVDLEAFFEVGPAPGPYSQRTTIGARKGGEPFSTELAGLSADTAYVYRLRFRRPGEPLFHAGPQRTFRTQRARGATFRFTVQADSHLDQNSDYALYMRTLGNVAADAPDFHLDLGDTFMCEKNSVPVTPTQAAVDGTPCRGQAAVNERYLFERDNFGRIGHSVPLFLVNGNHDGEIGFLLTPSGDDMPTWATVARKRFFLNPTPNGFYGGDALVHPTLGERAAWYAWEWGDALFVALDPYWNTTTRSSSNAWTWTLGSRQYEWLAQTLASSRAKFRFIFLHNLVGGLDGAMRGGVEAAPYFEWGGANLDGTDGFATNRPGWAKPLHRLFVDNKVTAIFHGHDHLYVHQELDGIVYQEVPQPSARNTNNAASLAAAYHYDSGTAIASAGHVRVTVGPDKVTTEYVRAWLPSAENAQRRNGDIADTYQMLPRP